MKTGRGSGPRRAGLVARALLVAARVADPVLFRPDPEPAYQNFKPRIRILLALTKNQFNHLNFFHINHMSSDI